MNPEPPVTAASTVAGQRVLLQALRRRRRRVLWRVAVFVGLTLLMVVLSVVNRDREAIQTCRTRMETAARVLRSHHADWLRDPQKFPLPAIASELGDVWRLHVLENWRFTEHAAFAREVGVCCCERPHNRLFLPAGRHVIIYNVSQQEYYVRWMDAADLAQRAEELGLRVRVGP